jgi:hydroxylamine reductase (hybrid-cluster protein)
MRTTARIRNKIRAYDARAFQVALSDPALRYANAGYACYAANIGKIGFIRQQWAVGAIIGFYSNLRELNDQAHEFLQNRPTVNATNESIAARLRLMSSNLSHAMDGLNKDRKFRIPQEIRLDQLFMPSGTPLSECQAVPENLQDVLLRLAGIVPR